jgi:hypothetical protein
VRVTVHSQGADLASLIRAQVRTTETASRKVGNVIKKAGVAAVRKAVPYKSFAGYPLKVKGKVMASGVITDVRIYGTPVGFWSMLESGAKPHPIYPRKGKALRAGSETFWAHVDHPGMRGRGVWSNAQPALKAAVAKAIEETFAVVTDG